MRDRDDSVRNMIGKRFMAMGKEKEIVCPLISQLCDDHQTRSFIIREDRF
jgi:hypothetical protein